MGLPLPCSISFSLQLKLQKIKREMSSVEIKAISDALTENAQKFDDSEIAQQFGGTKGIISIFAGARIEQNVIADVLRATGHTELGAQRDVASGSMGAQAANSTTSFLSGTFGAQAANLAARKQRTGMQFRFGGLGGGAQAGDMHADGIAGS